MQNMYYNCLTHPHLCLVCARRRLRSMSPPAPANKNVCAWDNIHVWRARARNEYGISVFSEHYVERAKARLEKSATKCALVSLGVY